jgi:hypothetical protein
MALPFVSHMPCAERSLFVRERADGMYHVVTYLLSKMFDELFIAAVATAIVSVCEFEPLVTMYGVVGVLTAPCLPSGCTCGISLSLLFHQHSWPVIYLQSRFTMPAALKQPAFPMQSGVHPTCLALLSAMLLLMYGHTPTLVGCRYVVWGPAAGLLAFLLALILPHTLLRHR